MKNLLSKWYDLHAPIETSNDGIFGSLGELLDILRNLDLGERTRNIAAFEILSEWYMRRANLVKTIALDSVWISCAPKCPNLENDVGLFGMDGVGYLHKHKHVAD